MSRSTSPAGRRLLAGALALGAGASPVPLLSAQSVVESLNIGTVEGRAEESFERIVEVRVAADGRIVVLDEGSGAIRVFDRTGRFLHGFGGTGEGPAEFRYIGAATLAGDTLVVLDREGGKLALFTLEGELIATRPTAFSVSRHGFPVRMQALRGGELVLETASGCSLPPREGADTQWRLLVLEPGASDFTELRRTDAGRALSVYGRPTPTFCTVLTMGFAPGPLAAVRPDGVLAFGTGDAAEVELRGEPTADPTPAAWFRGPPARVVGLPGGRRSLTRSDRAGWNETVVGERTGPDAPRDIVDRLREVEKEMEWPERWAAYDRLVYDPNGELWVRRPPPFGAATAEWDVLRADGTHRGIVSLPADLAVRAIAGGAVYGVLRGEWDEDRVKRYDIRW